MVNLQAPLKTQENDGESFVFEKYIFSLMDSIQTGFHTGEYFRRYFQTTRKKFGFYFTKYQNSCIIKKIACKLCLYAHRRIAPEMEVNRQQFSLPETVRRACMPMTRAARNRGTGTTCCGNVPDVPPYLGDTGSFPDVITAMDNWVAQKKGETKLDKFVIHGGHRLTGEIEVSGAKNAAVALIPAVLLSDEPCVLENVPDISDVSISLQIMSEMGATVEYLTKTTVRISAAGLTNYCVPYESARKMRASYYFLGALLGRYGKARVSMPGGCPLGDRPIDQHLKAFAALGAKCNIEHGMVDLVADQLTGNQIYLDVVSVGATMNAMLAAVRAKSLTVIENAAKEPHIVDLANFLNSMGAEIMGAGTDVIKIRGVERLHGAVYSVIPDQIEAGTFMIAAAATKGDVLVTNVIPKHLEPITSKMRKIGVNIEEFDDSVRVWVDGPLVRTNVKTMPHPGFPTDMQPQITTLLTLAEGTSIITEGVWEQRFRYVDELRRMGADISVDGKVAVVEGTGKLTGAPVKACDLRAGAALIVAGLAAHGVTEIEDIYHIERGYANLDAKLRQIGADIQKVSDPAIPAKLKEAL